MNKRYLQEELAFPAIERVRVRLTDLSDGKIYWRYHYDEEFRCLHGYEYVCHLDASGAVEFTEFPPRDRYGDAITSLVDLGLAPHIGDGGTPVWSPAFITSEPIPNGTPIPMEMLDLEESGYIVRHKPFYYAP